ncbi:MAG: beta-lactamase family protein [Clostridia bacterium]|nr:beta-lactamase family protein [Clostridia bacterium]MBR3714349.1 beta-lactamase family protein [Clostridia bacterium]
MKNTEKCVGELFASETVGNIIIRVGRSDDVLFELFRSREARTLTSRTLFDMASVTKIVVTTSLSLIAMQEGKISPSDKVSRFFSVPDDKNELSVWHLLTHTMGIGHKSMLKGGEYSKIQDYILSIPSDIPIGSNVLYSCPGFILLGRILEEVFGKRLDEAFYERVSAPLGMEASVFLPDRTKDIVNANIGANECGLVNDYNCRFLGGVAGNAGLFSNVDDLTKYVKALLGRPSPLFSEDILSLAWQNHTPNMDDSRGLGFLVVDERYAQTGKLFPYGSIGHCGHTGTSVFLDPKSKFYTIILSDATASTVQKYGKENYDEVKRMRHDLHEAIKKDLVEEAGK